MTDHKMIELGMLIRQTRKQQRLTQEQLAASTGVGVRFIRELEQGKASCHIGKALMVVTMLGLEIVIGGKTL
ncbi:MAG: type II toxin-antitoxin system Y4mF family antitoxin [Candidatus Puniceispirillaceae bacterium]